MSWVVPGSPLSPLLPLSPFSPFSPRSPFSPGTPWVPREGSPVSVLPRNQLPFTPMVGVSPSFPSLPMFTNPSDAAVKQRLSSAMAAGKEIFSACRETCILPITASPLSEFGPPWR